MPEKFYISDWHYGHKNCLAFDNRPFTTIEQMNTALVGRWKSVLLPGDAVYELAAMFWCNAATANPILNSLAGEIFLVKGNHDRCHIKRFVDQFVKVSEYMEIEDKDRKVVLCHYPIPCFKNHFYGWYHLYGHVHNSFEYNMMEHTKFLMKELYDRQCNMFNVGAMMPWMDYTPRTLNEIISTAKEEKANEAN